MLREGTSIAGFREMPVTKRPDNGFVFIYWQLLSVNVGLGAVSSFKTAGAFPRGRKCQLVYVYTAGHGPAFSACPPLFVAATVCAWGLGMSSLAAGWLG